MRGRLPETILQAERGVASNAARNRGFETPGPQPAMTNGRRRAFAPSPAATPGTQRVPEPATPRWSAERRRPGCAGRLTPRKRDVAPYGRDTLGSAPPGAPPAPSFRGGWEDGASRCGEQEQPGRKNAPREQRKTLFDIVKGRSERLVGQRRPERNRLHSNALGSWPRARLSASTGQCPGTRGQ